MKKNEIKYDDEEYLENNVEIQQKPTFKDKIYLVSNIFLSFILIIISILSLISFILYIYFSINFSMKKSKDFTGVIVEPKIIENKIEIQGECINSVFYFNGEVISIKDNDICNIKDKK